MEMRKFEAGEAIFVEGDKGNVAFILKSGQIKITVKVKDDTSRTLATVGPGSIFGEMALVDNTPRVASAIALEEGEAMVIREPEFQKRLAKSDPVIALLLKIYTERLRKQTVQLAGRMH
ncbi:MAG: cyclic nucleotide-binding domain-containing protein [Magnetovibrio sp.]|nr:cyclic nucleotide-binding domain-containing protein [Magnetovibrio sp.]